MIGLRSHHELIPTTGCNLNYTVSVLALNTLFKNNTTAVHGIFRNSVMGKSSPVESRADVHFPYLWIENSLW